MTYVGTWFAIVVVQAEEACDLTRGQVMAISPRLSTIMKAHEPRRIEGDELEQLRVNAAYRESAANVTRRIEVEARQWEHGKPSMPVEIQLQAVADAFGVRLPHGMTVAEQRRMLRALQRRSRKNQQVEAATAGYTGGGPDTKRTVKPSQARRRARRAQERARRAQ